MDATPEVMLVSECVVRARVRVTGRVQGVWYRQSTASAAQDLGLAGWVRNLPDGSVEAVAEGPRTTVERLVAFMEEGPPHASVEHIDIAWEEPEGEHGFAITS